MLRKMIPILLTLALVALWGVIVRRCMRAIRELRARIAQIKSSRMASYPESELPPLLRSGQEHPDERLWLRINEQGQQDPGLLSELPDVEEEKACAYYNRTGQIICNSKNRTLEKILTGHWYGYAEWLQDIISGRVNLSDLESVPDPGEEENRNGEM